MRTIRIKNNTNAADYWIGVQIQPGEYYTLQNDQDITLAVNDAKVNQDIWTSPANILINDGVNDLSAANGDKWLKNIDSSPKDADGAPLQRVKITQTGWHYQLHGLELETSKLSSIISNKVDNTSYGFTIIKFYKDVAGVETEITGDDLNQTFIDANCIKTVVDWEPTHDVELVGGSLKQLALPSSDLRLWIVGVPDVSEAYGGSKPFVTNVNMRYMGLEEGVKVDGRAPKLLAYNATYHTSKLRFIFRHVAGYNHKMHMVFELFKA